VAALVADVYVHSGLTDAQLARHLWPLELALPAPEQRAVLDRGRVPLGLVPFGRQPFLAMDDVRVFALGAWVRRCHPWYRDAVVTQVRLVQWAEADGVRRPATASTATAACVPLYYVRVAGDAGWRCPNAVHTRAGGDELGPPVAFLCACDGIRVLCCSMEGVDGGPGALAARRPGFAAVGDRLPVACGLARSRPDNPLHCFATLLSGRAADVLPPLAMTVLFARCGPAGQ
jgi:hypothetical protein